MEEDYLLDKQYYLDRIRGGRRAFLRGGKIFQSVFGSDKFCLSGKDLILIHNTYGIRVEYIILLAEYFGKKYDEDEFAELLIEQEKRMREMKPCSSGVNDVYRDKESEVKDKCKATIDSADAI